MAHSIGSCSSPQRLIRRASQGSQIETPRQNGRGANREVERVREVSAREGPEPSGLPSAVRWGQPNRESAPVGGSAIRSGNSGVFASPPAGLNLAGP